MIKVPICIATAVVLVDLAGCAKPAGKPRADATLPATSEPVGAPSPLAPPVVPAPAAPPAPSPRAHVEPQPEWREVFPHVRVNVQAKSVEFDATVPINAHDPDTPRIYLEVIACPPDTKEHEAVLVTHAKPSHVHAALLLIGLEPGSPGVWDWSGETLRTIPPMGPKVTVMVRYELNGKMIETNPAEWALDTRSQQTLAQSKGQWLFAGSQMYKRQGQEAYRADADGTLIGLTTFGGESIAWSEMYNPDSAVEEPHWIANAAKLPPFGTAVVVRIQPAQ